MDVRIGNSVDVDRDDRAGRQIDLVVSALAVSGGVDGRMKDRRRIEDIGVAGQGEVVGDVERGCDRVVRRVRSQRGVAGSQARAWRRVALIGEIAEQGVVAAAAVDRVVPALAGQYIGCAIAGQSVIAARTGKIFDGDIGISAGPASSESEHNAARCVGVVCRVAAGAAVQSVGAAAAGQRVVASAAGELIGLGIADEMVIERGTDGILEADEDIVPDRCASADDLHRTIAVAAAGRAVGEIDRHAVGAARVDDRVDAGTAIEIVLTGAADDRVVAGFAIDDVAIVCRYPGCHCRRRQ